MQQPSLRQTRLHCRAQAPRLAGHHTAPSRCAPASCSCSTRQTEQHMYAEEPNSTGTSYDWQRQELERAFSSQHTTSDDASLEFSAPWLSAPSGSDPPLWPGTHVLRVQVGGGPEPPKQKERQEKHEDFYANVGDAIRTLREDVPSCLRSDLNYNIYREDIVFRDPRNCFKGMKNYKTIFWSLRFHGNLFFKDLYVEVKRIWQKTDETICLRWTVHGLPRLPWDTEGTFDGVSTYTLDSHGKIYEHKVDNVIMGDPPMLRSPLMVTLNLVRQPAQTPFPTPWVPHPTTWLPDRSLQHELNDDYLRSPPGAA